MLQHRYLSKFIFLLFILIVGCQPYRSTNSEATKHNSDKDSYVLLISFDGFRHDYAEKYNLPNFHRMMKEGSYTEAMLPSFPSKTFPNHYAIITGMYPGNNGLVDNKFYDPNRDDIYSIGDRNKVEDPYYYGGTPLWQHLQNKGIKTASFFWVGSETPIMGTYPTYYYKYNGRISNEKRIEQVAKWFRLPKEKRPRFVTLYFSLVDTEGHHSGPNSEKLKTVVREADRLMGMVLDSVQSIDLPITTIVVSDHGMTEMHSRPENLIFIEEKLAPISDKIRVVNNGMHAHIYLKKPEEKDEIYNFLKTNFAKIPVIVYKKEETPERWHYRENNRIGDILVITSSPNYMLTNEKQPIAHKKGSWGTHGYDPYTTPDMGAIFYAVGPVIKSNYKIPKFENVDVYALITNILGVDNPKDIDGDPKTLEVILK